eukprot:4453884-Ditylum_brightwellii.AAC.1
MTGFAQSQIRMKCTYLTVAPESALYSFYKKERKVWQECCEEFILVMQDIPMGICPIISVSMKDKTKVPAVFTVYPDFKDA